MRNRERTTALVCEALLYTQLDKGAPPEGVLCADVQTSTLISLIPSAEE